MSSSSKSSARPFNKDILGGMEPAELAELAESRNPRPRITSPLKPLTCVPENSKTPSATSFGNFGNFATVCRRHQQEIKLPLNRRRWERPDEDDGDALKRKSNWAIVNVCSSIYPSTHISNDLLPNDLIWIDSKSRQAALISPHFIRFIFFFIWHLLKFDFCDILFAFCVAVVYTNRNMCINLNAMESGHTNRTFKSYCFAEFTKLNSFNNCFCTVYWQQRFSNVSSPNEFHFNLVKRQANL